MTLIWQVAISLIVIGVLLALVACVKRSGDHWHWPPEVQRKLVHVAIGLSALMFPLIFSDQWPVLLILGLAIVIMLVLRLPRHAQDGIGSALHSVGRTSYGDFLFAAAIGITYLRAREEIVLYVLPIAVLTLADAAAALTGSRYGRRLFTVEDGTKSLEGVVMFFLITWIVAMVILLLLTDIARINVIGLALVIAVFGALVEADSWRGFDNLFVPIGIHLFLQTYLQASAQTLLILVTLFVLAVVAILLLAQIFAFNAHTARAYGIMFFLIGSFALIHNAVLPMMTVFAHMIAHRARPSSDPQPDLALIVVIAVVSLFWLMLGDMSGVNAINYYNMTFAGMTIGFACLALRHNRALMPVLGGLIMVTGVAFFLIVAQNRGLANNSRGDFHVLLAIIMGVCAGAALLLERHFNNRRAFKVALLALVIPFLAFAMRAWNG